MTEFSVGDYVVDVEADHEKKLVVVGTPGVAADEWTVYETDDGEVTVADDNPDYPADATVVLACFLEDDRHDKSITDLDGWRDSDNLFQRVCNEGVVFYAFPDGRLKPADDTATDGGQVLSEQSAAEDLERIRDELTRLGWKDVHVDETENVVLVEKFGSHRVYPDGTVESDRDTLRSKLKTAVDGVV